MIDVETPFDQLETRCPRLGGPVAFGYCRKSADGLPCQRSLICWNALFPVDRYMAKVLSVEEWQHCFARPGPDKMVSILKAAGTAG